MAAYEGLLLVMRARGGLISCESSGIGVEALVGVVDMEIQGSCLATTGS